MNPEQLDLRDVHLPEVPAWWPPAIGWWLLAAAVLAAAVLAIYWWRRHRSERVRRLALAELDALARRCADAPQRLPAEMSIWLRRVALSLAPRGDVAGLTGNDWLAVLERMSPGSRLPAEWQQLLLEGPYAPAPASEEELRRALDACRDWTMRLELSR